MVVLLYFDDVFKFFQKKGLEHTLMLYFLERAIFAVIDCTAAVRMCTLHFSERERFACGATKFETREEQRSKGLKTDKQFGLVDTGTKQS